MTRAERLRALAERAGKGEMGRTLDAEIMFDLFAKPVGRKEDGGPSGYLWPENNASWNFGIRFPGKDRNWFEKVRAKNQGETLLIDRDGALVLMNAVRIPPLTTSIDAQAVLGVRISHMAWHPEGCTASDDYGAEGTAPTEPVARLAAILRALAEKEDAAHG